MVKFLNKYKYLLVLTILLYAAVGISFLHNIGLIIDCGREVYYPQEILNGKVLYKDLFNIYGPFSYLFNALLYKIFGVNLNTLAVAGAFCGIYIILLLFVIAKRFIGEGFAFCLSIFNIAVGILSRDIFNYTFPYSFGLIYGMLGFFTALFFLFNFIDTNKKLYLYASLFCAGLSVSAKYEFLPCLLIFLIVFFKHKIDLKTCLISLVSFSIIPLICLITLIFQGLRLIDILETVYIISTMAKSVTLKYFYTYSGILPYKESPRVIFFTFLAMFIPFFVYICPVVFKKQFQNKFITWIFALIAFCIMIFFKNNTAYDVFVSIPVVLTVLMIIYRKKLFEDSNLCILTLSALLMSIKVYWGPVVDLYGNFYLPILFIAIFAIIRKNFTEKDWKYISIYVLVLSSLIGFNNFVKMLKNTYEVSTEKGIIFTEKKYEPTTGELISYIEKNTKKTDRIIIYPEGMMINFLTDRKTDDFFNVMIPLYEETFGDISYIEHFKKDMPEYIILNSRTSPEYYFSLICDDYAKSFCEFTKNNYTEEKRLLGEFSYKIYKKK